MKAERRPDGSTHWEEDFLRVLAEHKSVYRAAQAAGVTRRAAYDEREANPAFAARWAEILEGDLDNLEATVRVRAREGWDETAETVAEDGKGRTTTKRIWDPNLAKWVLERQRASKWGPQREEADSAPPPPVVVLTDASGAAELQRLQRENDELRKRLEGSE